MTRTWHTQLGIFWIATAWLATGLFVAPAVSGREPRFQKAGVNFLFACLLLTVGGSMWYARSAEFLQTDTMELLRWMRVIGDSTFAVGVLALGWFVLGLRTGWSLQREADAVSLSLTHPAAIGS